MEAFSFTNPARLSNGQGTSAHEMLSREACSVRLNEMLPFKMGMPTLRKVQCTGLCSLDALDLCEHLPNRAQSRQLLATYVHAFLPFPVQRISQSTPHQFGTGSKQSAVRVPLAGSRSYH